MTVRVGDAAVPARPAASAAPPASSSPPAPEPPGLRVSSSDALAPGARIGDLAAARVDGGIILAWVTYVEQVPDQGKKRPSPAARTASVAVRALSDRGDPSQPAPAISSRANSVGGVAMATAAGAAEVGVAWTGIDQGRSQVFLTRVGPDGQKKGQRMVSRAKGSASDVALAAVADGWIAAWVETRDGEVEVRATKVSRALDKVGAERVVTHHPGDASEVRVIVRGEEILLVWADARAGQGSSDVYTARLALSDLGWRGDEARLTSESDHARGLRVAARGDDVLLAWIETPPVERPSVLPLSAAVIAQIDSWGRLRASPRRVPADATAGSVGIGCDGSDCRVVLGSAGPDTLDLSGFVWNGSGTIPRPARIASFERVATEDVSLNVLGEWIFFAEDNLQGGGRIRKLRVAWE